MQVRGGVEYAKYEEGILMIDYHVHSTLRYVKTNVGPKYFGKSF